MYFLFSYFQLEIGNCCLIDCIVYFCCILNILSPPIFYFAFFTGSEVIHEFLGSYPKFFHLNFSWVTFFSFIIYLFFNLVPSLIKCSIKFLVYKIIPLSTRFFNNRKTHFFLFFISLFSPLLPLFLLCCANGTLIIELVLYEDEIT